MNIPVLLFSIVLKNLQSFTKIHSEIFADFLGNIPAQRRHCTF